MVIYSIELGSVHLSKSDLYELESCLRSLSESSEIVFQTKSNGFPVLEATVRDLVHHTFNQGHSLSYDIRYICNRGKLRIVADSTEKESHLLYAEGEEEWVETAVERITRFMDSRKNIWRSWINKKIVLGLEVIASIAFANSIGLFLPAKMLYPAINILDYLVLMVSAIVLFSTYQRNLIYPYFSVSMEGVNRYPKIRPLLIPLLFLLGFILPWVVG